VGRCPRGRGGGLTARARFYTTCWVARPAPTPPQERENVGSGRRSPFEVPAPTPRVEPGRLWSPILEFAPVCSLVQGSLPPHPPPATKTAGTLILVRKINQLFSGTAPPAVFPRAKPGSCALSFSPLSPEARAGPQRAALFTKPRLVPPDVWCPPLNEAPTILRPAFSILCSFPARW